MNHMCAEQNPGAQGAFFSFLLELEFHAVGVHHRRGRFWLPCSLETQKCVWLAALGPETLRGQGKWEIREARQLPQSLTSWTGGIGA